MRPRSTKPQPAPTSSATPAQPPAFISKQVRKARLFFQDLSPKHGTKTRVVCGGFEECAPDYAIDRDDFAWLSLEFVAAGQGSLRLGSTDTLLRPGVFFLYGPGIRHAIRTEAKKPLEKYFVDFCGSEAETLLKRLGLAPGFVGECLQPGLLREHFEHLLRYGVRRGSFEPYLCAAKLTELLVTCAENAAEPGSLGSRAYLTFERCRTLIERDFVSLHALRDIAAKCHIDPAYLCRLFHRFGRETPHQFLLRQKINHASELLLQSDLPVKAVAQAVGVADPFHFSKIFRRFQGVPPAHFGLRQRQAQSKPQRR